VPPPAPEVEGEDQGGRGEAQKHPGQTAKMSLPAQLWDAHDQDGSRRSDSIAAMWQKRCRHLIPLTLFWGLLGLAACGAAGTTSSDDTGGAAGTGGGGGVAGDPWPSTDDDPGSAPTGSPDFGAAGGAGAAGAAGGAGAAPTCSGKKGPKGEMTVTVAAGGLLRTAIVHVPDKYDPTQPAMLVLNIHGFSSNAIEEEVLSRMNTASDQKGFLAIYPDGVASSWNAGQCCGTSWVDGVDDVGFLKKLLAQIEADYCIDTRRVYATGMSNGGFLSHRLGCEMADVFAAIAPVAGVMGIPSCKPSRPVPVIEFHGTSDPLVPYNGGNPVLNLGIQGTFNFDAVGHTVQGWRDRDGCTETQETIYQKGDATCVRWPECQGQSEVVFCTIDGGGHTWPGGVPIPAFGKTSADLSATTAMIQFFEAHPMP
jgi:polyhydroxybutyrate depolymerase